jgi:precorrin-6B methylase 2
LLKPSDIPPPPRQPHVHTRLTRQGLELRVDGTLASLLKPGRVTSGPVWDAIAAPLLALPPDCRRSLLMVGFGAGSVARLARALAPSLHIVGVERDEEVLAVARREFGLDALEAELVVDDALSFLKREGRVFDVVVEDLFGGSRSPLHKPDKKHPRQASDRLRVAPGGVFVTNTIHENRQLARILKRTPGTLLRVAVKHHYNHILALGPAGLEASALRRTIRSHPILSPSLTAFSLRTLRA